MPAQPHRRGVLASQRRTARDWGVDALLFGFAVVVWLVGWLDSPPHYADAVPAWALSVDPWVGAVACLALWWRRRFPLTLALAMVAVLAVAGTALGAALVAVLTVAVHRGWLAATIATGLHLLAAVPFGFQYPPPGVTPGAYVMIIVLMYLVPLGFGMAVRARRQLLANQRRAAERERVEQERAARRAERERIAQEMHDVLGHRISLASVHAGALAYRMAQADAGRGEPLDPAEVRRAVGVINDTVRLAMVELSEVLAVLRSDEGTVRGRPQPGLADLEALVAEAQAAGQQVTLEADLPASAAARLRPSGQRTVYRVVQEGLTNARKHAPAAPVAVAVRASDDGLLVTVTNPVAPSAATAPGARSGLAGLSERVALDGGTLEHGVVDGTFRLVARLPWPS
jgi:Signal transduction histidine kinase